MLRESLNMLISRHALKTYDFIKSDSLQGLFVQSYTVCCVSDTPYPYKFLSLRFVNLQLSRIMKILCLHVGEPDTIETSRIIKALLLSSSFWQQLLLFSGIFSSYTFPRDDKGHRGHSGFVAIRFRSAWDVERHNLSITIFGKLHLLFFYSSSNQIMFLKESASHTQNKWSPLIEFLPYNGEEFISDWNVTHYLPSCLLNFSSFSTLFLN